MNFISVMAITEEIARDQAIMRTGYEPHTIGALVVVVDQHTSSRQKAFVFETTNDVTGHQLFARAKLSDTIDLPASRRDGPVLAFGPELTAGG